MELFIRILVLPLVYYAIYLCKKAFKARSQCCYMLAYECYKPAGDERMLDTETCAKVLLRNKNLGLEEYQFLLKTMVSSGVGEQSYGPENVIAGREACPTEADALSEVDDVMFDTLDKLFAKTGVSPSAIDILVVNVSLFAPSPSLTARLINRYKMRHDIKAFNLSGEGCSASVQAIDLVQHMFKTYKNSLAIVVSTESMGPHWYCGKDKSMMLSNLLFRSGGCSMLLTNKTALKNQALLKLTTSVRTHIGADEDAYNCCMQVEDSQGHQGFLLRKTLTRAAARAFTANFRVLLPKILPVRELLGYAIKSAFTKKSKNAALEGLNLKSCIEHFCLHPGGRAVIDGLGESLRLSEYDLEPARMALHRYGNTSAGGLWYVLGYMEAKKRLKKGDKILMISLGAGFMCNNCVWQVMKDLEDTNVWKDCLDRYPIKSTENPFMEKYSWIFEEENYLKQLDINALDKDWLESKLGFSVVLHSEMAQENSTPTARPMSR